MKQILQPETVRRISTTALGPLSARLLYALLLLLPAIPVSAASFTANVDRSTISLGESILLRLKFVNCAPAALPEIPAIPDMAVRYNGASRHTANIQGQTTASFIYTYMLTPRQTGTYTVPAISVKLLGGGTVDSEPVELRVVDASEIVELSDQARRPVFLNLVVPEKPVYVGQIFPIEIHLYVDNIQDLHMPQIQGDGFVFGQPVQQEPNAVQLGGRLYRVLSFRATATAVKAGRVPLGPAECRLTVPVRPRGGSTLFDFFGAVNARELTVRSEPKPVQVLPLPEEGRPDAFNGAVGQFALEMTGSPTNVTAGDPITLRVRIAGAGPIESLPFPPQSWDGFKTYPPERTVSPKADDPLGLSGQVFFEQVVIPLKSDLTAVPPLRFSFFDPSAREYRTETSSPIPITVRAASAVPALPAQAGQPDAPEIPPEPQMVHIQPRLGPLASLPQPAGIRPVFLVVHSLPVLAWLGALFWRRRQESLEKNPRLRRRREVDARVRLGLKELRAFAESNRPEPFFAATFRLLQERLGERLEMPAGAITEAVVDERLRAEGAPDDLLRDLHDLFQICNQARYAPGRTGRQLTALYARVETVLTRLRDDRSVAPA